MATYQQNHGLKEWRISPKPNQTNSTPRETTMGQVQRITGGDPTKLGHFGPSPGAAGHTPTYSDRPDVWSVDSCHLSNDGYMGIEVELMLKMVVWLF
jgi:hypothetical protein